MKKFQGKKMIWIVVMFVSLFLFLNLETNEAKEEAEREAEEYALKAALLYKFLLSIDWPREVFKSPEDPIIIGVFGRDHFGDELKKVSAIKTVDGRKLVIKRFKQNTLPGALKQCHLLFINPISRSRMKKLLDSLKNYPILTVSEVKGFGHLGGMINFVIAENRVKFEINKGAADHAGVTIRSRLLKAAIRIIGEDHAK